MPRFKAIKDLTEEVPKAELTTIQGSRASRVRAAREHLAGRALDYVQQLEAAIAQAIAKGEYEVAMETLKWLIDHTPADEEGKRMLEGSTDKKHGDSGNKGPSIQIGIALGGVGNTKPLPQASIIDIEEVK